MKCFTMDVPGIKMTGNMIVLDGYIKVAAMVEPVVVIDDYVIECVGEPTDALVLMCPPQVGPRGWHILQHTPDEEWERYAYIYNWYKCHGGSKPGVPVPARFPLVVQSTGPGAISRLIRIKDGDAADMRIHVADDRELIIPLKNNGGKVTTLKQRQVVR